MRSAAARTEPMPRVQGLGFRIKEKGWGLAPRSWSLGVGDVKHTKTLENP